MSKKLELPQPIAAFIAATNEHNTDRFRATLTDSAVVTDEGQDYRGIIAIQEWSDEKYIGAKVTLAVVNVVHRNGKTIVTAALDGNFDKTGLPDPFCMDLHFTVEDNKITALSFKLPRENKKRERFGDIFLAVLKTQLV
jgi:SnoaL-like domain